MHDAMKVIRQSRRASMAVVAWLCVLGGVCLFPGFSFAAPSPEAVLGPFAYDGSVSLNVKQISVKVRDGVSIQNITYIGSNGDTVPAYLVVPKGTGKFAAIIWGHWMKQDGANPNRDEFLEEAIALAPAGVISLLIDAPQNRPNFRSAPWYDPAVMEQQVVDLRRGLDLLLSRPDIDATRIAYVGHSFGAEVGAILDATEKRFAAFVFMSGPQSQWPYSKSYAGKLGPAPALFQYGSHDELVPLADAKDYLASASGPKTVEFYDADHALNTKARVDRDSFLGKRLRLSP